MPQVTGYIKLSVEAAPWVGPNSDWEKVMPEEDEVLIDWVRVWQRDVVTRSRRSVSCFHA